MCAAPSNPALPTPPFTCPTPWPTSPISDAAAPPSSTVVGGGDGEEAIDEVDILALSLEPRLDGDEDEVVNVHRTF
jgi:hypothetical protein